MNNDRLSKLSERIADISSRVTNMRDMRVEGRLIRIIGLTMEAVGCQSPVGSRCKITNSDGKVFEAEVVGFAGEKTYLMTTEEVHGLAPGARITPMNKVVEVPVGNELLGRIIDGQGNPLDNKGPIRTTTHYPLAGKSINPLDRDSITKPLDVGIRSINSLLTVGRGQRLGLFAGSGVGKSVLLGMMSCYTSADVTVVGLIGERGREVKEFIENNLGEQGLQRSVVLAAPADTSPLMRLHGAMWATTIAEYFRDQGAHVLLLLDSLTRFAMAQRELGLAIGEPPATKGYPPSVFAKLSKLVERTGTGVNGKGSITAFYTVLSEGDDQQDPIADSARSFLDGHIVLSRTLADAGHYPAIDIEQSISRVMPSVTSREHQGNAKKFKQLLSKYQQNRDLINIGAYQAGSDPELDIAIRRKPELYQFLAQEMHEKFDYHASVKMMSAMFTEQANATENLGE